VAIQFVDEKILFVDGDIAFHEDCCCDPPYDCETEDCSNNSSAIISGGGNCTGDCDMSEFPVGGIGSGNTSECYWQWVGSNPPSFTKEYQLEISNYGAWFAEFSIYEIPSLALLCSWQGTIDPATCVDGILTASGTLTNAICDSISFSVG
jgi:hypothetical protein